MKQSMDAQKVLTQVNDRSLPRRNYKYHDIHVTAAEAIAGVAKDCGVPRFVHVSHLNASHDSPSTFYRAKAAGEDVVKSIYPDAVIIRPGPFYGIEDKLLNSMACT